MFTFEPDAIHAMVDCNRTERVNVVGVRHTADDSGDFASGYFVFYAIGSDIQFG